MNRSRLRCSLALSVTMLGGCAGGTQHVTTAVSGSSAPPAAPAPAPTTSTPSGTVFTVDNAVAGSALHAFGRAADGTLQQAFALPTGGVGVGHGLENQGAVALSRDHTVLLAVNPGSNDVSSFLLTGNSPLLVSRIASGGTIPISVAEAGGLVYVVNAGSPNSVSGFRLATDGSLTAVANSTRRLSADAAGPAQIAFSGDGKVLLVTERSASHLDSFVLQSDGTPGPLSTSQSAGTQPFGFAVLGNGDLVVSEAGAGTVSSYGVGADASIKVISSAVQTQQTTACWAALTPDNRYAFIANTASGSLSTFAVATDGSLTLRTSIAATTYGGPLDLSVSADGQWLTALTTSGHLQVFRIDATTGALTQVQDLAALPGGTTGLAER